MRRYRTGAVVLIILTLDQLSKQLFKAADFTLIEGIIDIKGTRNTGAAFGFFGGGALPLALLGGAVALGLAVYLVKAKPAGFFGLGLTLALAGALGNLIDRVRQGFVIDFLSFSFVNFPVFNLADIAITLGCALAAVGVLSAKEAANG